MSERSAELAQWSRGPILTPNTAKSLITAFAAGVPSSTNSPDSSYSATSPDCISPTFPSDSAFEFDNSHEEIQTSEYDDMRERTAEDGEEAEGNEWNVSSFRRPSWALSATGAAGGSVISMSPRGSLSTRAGSFSGSIDGRRESIPKAPKLPYQARRQSNPSLLGFDLSEIRRRSSARSLLNGTRRRSSGLSYISNSFSVSGGQSRSSSIFDPIEDSRLRNFASLELLRRRFSEVVEVTPYDGMSDGEENLDKAWDYQGWSPYSGSEDGDYGDRYESDYDYDEDESEIHTESYVPSPEMRNGSFVPALYSNFPLESVAVVPTALPEDGSSEISSLAGSPLLRAPRFIQSTSQMIGTPPAPPHPSDILRNRTRPALNRAVTSYGAPRTAGVPPGAALPRPGLARSISNPLISSALSTKEATKASEIRAAGSFPLARTTPLGTSPLRESLRRQSVVSESEASRQSSLAERRRSSLAPGMGMRRETRGSMNSEQEATRRASLAERRMSLVKESVFRRMSGEPRRTSKGISGRKSSEVSLRNNIKGEARRRSSKDSPSRQSSVVSIGEYGYLAPQIVIDAPKITPPTDSAPTVPSPPKEARRPQTAHSGSEHCQIHRLRSNAPPSIVLPAYTFPALSTSGPLSPTNVISPTSTTPTFNPLSYFLNNDPSPTSTSPYDPMNTPTAIKSFFPMNSGVSSPRTPKIVNVIDRGRPIASPEYDLPESSQALPFKAFQPPSPKSSTIPLPPTTPTTEDVPEDNITPRTVMGRKAVPKYSDEDLRTKRNEEAKFRIHKEIDMIKQLNSRRGGTSPIIPQGEEFSNGIEKARIVGEQNAKKTISIEDMHLVLVNATESSGEIGTLKKIDRPIVRRYGTDELENVRGYNNKRPSTSRGLSRLNSNSRPMFSRGISAPVLINSTNSMIESANYTFPPNFDSSSSSSSTKIIDNSTNQIKDERMYQFPQYQNQSNKGKEKMTTSTTALNLPIIENEKTINKRRSITFIEPASPRSSRPKFDRTISFTKFFQSKSKNKQENNSNSSSSTSSSSGSTLIGKSTIMPLRKPI
ncbi:uncharacterized protein I206_104641 [Kwoniella pini CBS 10737]|uniref:Uncharacterized protein n=1 Tax=Kwoniella pini CBS 10737 TaxID=1296096 RepID=A0A1B9I7G6_9TREE|nr:uncharacterized protein I206_02177 [Kwoniella pini CBS 10737]OCF51463.1 hypothetical protein I206_02177 [Kwoniella pini CBS 10737]